jgi:hypothetical protein
LDSALSDKLNDLAKKVADASFQVSTVVESDTEPELHEIEACHNAVAAVTALWNELVNAAPENQRLGIERTHGRRVTDLRRLAAKLPQKSIGRTAQPAAPSAAGFPDYHLRVDPVSGTKPGGGPSMNAAEEGRKIKTHHSVGGLVEGWCGPCDGLRQHTITAMVSGEPKQVICESCGGRHGYRTTPARSREKAAAGPAQKERVSRGQAEATKREEARTALQKELAGATEVRTFQLRQRYKVGEIIEHVQFGRGKIENVLKGSLLVRFRDGLKSVNNL